MIKKILKFCCLVFIFLQGTDLYAFQETPIPRLHVEAQYLKDPNGNIVNLHGFAQTYSPWFNERGTKWNNYDVNGCLNYNKGIIDGVLAAGWKMNFVRMHMDPYWSNIPGCEGRYEGEECFSEERFIKYLDEVFIPMAEYAVSKGLYVIFRPPGVCPEEIRIGGVYQEYLIKVWSIVSKHPKLKNHPNIMYELANEPIRILGPNGTYGSSTQGHFDNLKTYFQTIVDTIRTVADNILWIPGLGWQSQYQGYGVNPIEGENIGYAVHVYPGWFNSGSGYDAFQNGWNAQVKPVADRAPIVVTEMDWAPEKYDASWGKDITGTAGGEGFGANFKKIVDNAGNVSWLLFTDAHYLKDFTGIPPAEGEAYTFLNDPEACPWPIYHWYLDYAEENYPKPDFEYRSQSDNGDGSFANPVINGDFPSPAVFKVDDMYYMVSSNMEINPDTTLLKSKDLINWEYNDEPLDSIPSESIVLVDNSNINSGTLIQTQTGEWWAMKSYDKGSLGKFPHLLPVSWVDGNPVIEETYKDSVEITNPDVGREYIPTSLSTNDVFRHYKLSPQWGWLQEPDDTKWSLLDRPGFLRLNTVSVVDSIHKSQNILSQRILVYPSDMDNSYATIKMEIDSMLEGDVAGLTIFQDTFAYIGVKVIAGEKKLVTYINNEMLTGPTVSDSVIYLRALTGFNTDSATFYYSTDNSTYTKLGNGMVLGDNPTADIGNRFGIFNFATVSIGGFVDIDWFSTESAFGENEFYPENFETYTVESLTLTDLYVDGGEDITVLTKGITKINLIAVFTDGHTEDVATEASFFNYNPDVISVSNGNIISLKDGEGTLDVTYTGPLGEQRQVTLNVTSSIFPLKDGLFNPDIWENGTFDESTKTLKTGTYGFGGWEYDAIDFSEYKYLVARLGSANKASVSFRVFDVDDYWSTPASYSFGNNGEVIVRFETDLKDDDETPIDPSHIFKVGFWSNGTASFVIDTVFLSNSSEFDPPAVYAKDTDENELESLDGFNYMQGFGPSSNQSILVSGDHLSGGITITSPDNFEITADTTLEYSSSITIAQLDGLINDTAIFIRMKSGLSSDSYTGDVVISSEGAVSKSVSLSGVVDPGPEITVSSPSLSGFTYTLGSDPSQYDSLMVSGTLLVDSIVIEVSGNFEISLSSGAGYDSTLTLDQNNGEVSGTYVYVRLTSDLEVDTYDGEISLTSTGATTQTILLSGTVEQVTGINPIFYSKITVVSEEYYTLTGQKIESIDNRSGIFIVLKRMSDGTISTTKIFKNKN